MFSNNSRTPACKTDLDRMVDSVNSQPAPKPKYKVVVGGRDTAFVHRTVHRERKHAFKFLKELFSRK